MSGFEITRMILTSCQTQPVQHLSITKWCALPHPARGEGWLWVGLQQSQ